jgi:hypothetical protein
MENKTFNTTAVQHRNGNMFTAFGIHSITAGVYGYKESDIIHVECTIADDQTIQSSGEQSKDKDLIIGVGCMKVN